LKRPSFAIKFPKRKLEFIDHIGLFIKLLENFKEKPEKICKALRHYENVLKFLKSLGFGLKEQVEKLEKKCENKDYEFCYIQINYLLMRLKHTYELYNEFKRGLISRNINTINNIFFNKKYDKIKTKLNELLKKGRRLPKGQLTCLENLEDYLKKGGKGEVLRVAQIVAKKLSENQKEIFRELLKSEIEKLVPETIKVVTEAEKILKVVSKEDSAKIERFLKNIYEALSKEDKDLLEKRISRLNEFLKSVQLVSLTIEDLLEKADEIRQKEEDAKKRRRIYYLENQIKRVLEEMEEGRYKQGLLNHLVEELKKALK